MLHWQVESALYIAATLGSIREIHFYVSGFWIWAGIIFGVCAMLDSLGELTTTMIKRIRISKEKLDEKISGLYMASKSASFSSIMVKKFRLDYLGDSRWRC